MSAHKGQKPFSKIVAIEMKKSYFSLFSFIILLAVVLALVVVTTQVYSASSAMSKKAAELTGGTTLCRNITEVYMACSGEDEFLVGTAELGYELQKAENGYIGRFNSDFISDTTGIYILKVDIKDNISDYGNLRDISVMLLKEDELINEVNTSKYIPQSKGVTG